jgi:hypothetical protein
MQGKFEVLARLDSNMLVFFRIAIQIRGIKYLINISIKYDGIIISFF